MEPDVRPNSSLANGFPDSMACTMRYWRIDSGIASQSSPVSMLFLANSFIFARLGSDPVSKSSQNLTYYPPVLEPNLYGSFGHIDILRNALPDSGDWGGVLVEFHLQSAELVLCGPLPFLILLLLGESALSRWSARARVACWR